MCVNKQYENAREILSGKNKFVLCYIKYEGVTHVGRKNAASSLQLLQ